MCRKKNLRSRSGRAKVLGQEFRGQSEGRGTQGKSSWYVGALGLARSWAWGWLGTDRLGSLALGEVGWLGEHGPLWSRQGCTAIMGAEGLLGQAGRASRGKSH